MTFASRACLSAVTVMFTLSGCIGRSSREYEIVSAKHYNEEFGGQDRDNIRYTIKYQGKTIIAHCQAFDPKNKCRELEVGHRYPFKRDKKLFDTLSLDDPDSTLAVEEERIDH